MTGQNLEQGEQVLQHVCHFLQRLCTLLCNGFSFPVIENVDEIEGWLYSEIKVPKFLQHV